MQFTFEAYRDLVNTCRNSGYTFADYQDYDFGENPCILRHDIDYSLEKSLRFAEFEHYLGVKSTYFVLISSDFYNVFSKKNGEILREIQGMGHEIGLHFDETAYGNLDSDSMISAILREKDLLQDIVRGGVTAVSMHRPSRWVLETDLKIPGMVNSYGKEFFQNFKYVSDSRMRWREDVIKYVTEKTYPRLHILTHAFWYNDENLSLHDALDRFLSDARRDRYDILNENFTDLPSVIAEQEP